jgi:integrase
LSYTIGSLVASGSRAGSMTPEQARTQAKKVLASVASGSDPAAERAASNAVNTVGDLVTQFLEAKTGGNRLRRASTLRDYRRYLDNYLTPLHNRPVAEVTKVEVAGLIIKIERNRSPTVARSFTKALSSFLSWCHRKGLVTSNIAATIEKPEAPEPRERRLSGEEIAAVWKATRDSGDYSKIIRLLLLSGQRLSEIAHLSWGEIDLGKRLIAFDKARIKNRSQHMIPMSDAMFDIISNIKKRDGTDYVFGRLTTPFSGFSKGQKQLLACLTDMAKWSPHDLRRTFQTSGIDLGIPPWIIESVVNHLPSGAARSYDYSRMIPQKANALQQWADHVMKIVGENERGNVIALPLTR